MMKKNGEVLRKSAAEIAFGLRQYKEIVDNVLSRFNLAKERNNYQQTFDGFAQQLHQEILQCVKTLK
jgi:hypothetical protein